MKVKVGKKEYELPEAEAAFIEAIKLLTHEMRRLANK